jgi:hypothetical protein
MDIFSIDLTHNEIVFIRQSLDLPTISGRDAKFLANLQAKLESEIIQIEQLKAEEQQKKAEALQKIIEDDQKKGIPKK